MPYLRWGVPALLLAAAAPASADSTDSGASPPAEARDAAATGGFTPAITRAANVGRGIAVATMELNRATDQTTLDVTGEVRVFGPVRLVLGVSGVFETARPRIGAAVQLLDEQRHGVASSAYLSYKAEGFSEPEGEIEALVAFGKQLGPLRGTLNLAYGQDPEGRERDGEAAAALHVEPVRGLFAGVVGRYRDALGSDGDKSTGVVRDVLAGATATLTLGRFGLTLTGGLTGFATKTEPMKTGTTGLVSLGSVF